MSRSARVFIGRSDTVALCAEWLSKDRPQHVRWPLINAGSYATGRPHTSGQPRAPPPNQKGLGRSGPGPVTCDQTANDRDDDASKPMASRQLRGFSGAEATPKRQPASGQHASAPIPGLLRVPHPS